MRVVPTNHFFRQAGENNNRMRATSWEVRRWAGRSATLQIVDDESGGWGNVGIDDIIFSDSPRAPLGPLGAESDFGTMALTLFNAGSGSFGAAEIRADVPSGACDGAGTQGQVKKPFGQKLAPSASG